MRDPHNFFFIVTYKESVVGCILYKHFLPGDVHSFFQVYYMAISRDFVNKNLGTLLMNKLINFAISQNVFTILA